MKRYIIVLIHVGYWLVYLFMMTLLLAALDNGKHPFSLQGVIGTLFLSPFGFAGLLPSLFGFYFSYFYLFNKYLSKKKILHFLFFALAVSFLSAALAEVFMYIAYLQNPVRFHVNWNFNTCFFAGIFLAFISLVHEVMSLFIKTFVGWFQDIELKAEMSKKNYEVELALIKAQIDPHFLFNTINNIDTLIDHDASRASNYLNKLSDIMRFMLYETKVEKIELSKELHYIKEYIDLQKIRTSNPNYIKYNVQGVPDDIRIEPMLFIPFIENAFKHSEIKKAENSIRINFLIEKDKISFECENNFENKRKNGIEKGGLGKELIERRLKLLYPEKYLLNISEADNIYNVKLTISI